ncbi:queuosine precursor transporter [Actinobacillus pleuropneumoniae]|uniref:queuosine precursor transporter n=1 Tax=Actinobacillus pleuropneumoniae TaxID=715 RepID=UPI00201CFC24|nr:queuosine precursor transporter [Actinobacillus pleuropneumoniae]UQZ25752.1 queuosine precursor transporter [Actinobacillus pleuropneumoniae]
MFRIALASFLCLCGGGSYWILWCLTAYVRAKTWWLAPMCSTIFGTLIDTFAFFAVAFYKSDDAYMAEHWFTIGTVDYTFKLFVSLLLFFTALWCVTQLSNQKKFKTEIVVWGIMLKKKV